MHACMLLDLGLVKLERLESPPEGKGKERKYYAITLFGLLFYANIDKKHASDNFEKMVSAHAEKLLTFTKWGYFKDRNLDTLVKHNFFEQLHTFVGARLMEIFAFGGVILHNMEKEMPRKNVDWEILAFRWMYRTPEESKRMVDHKYGEKMWPQLMALWEAVEEDYDLRMLRDEFLFWNINRHNESIRALKAWKTFFEKDQLDSKT